MKRTLLKCICLTLFLCGIAELAKAQGIVVNKLDGTKVYFKASEVVSVGVYGYGEGPDDASDIHEYVDLGLPSGTLWATMNVGAEKPEDYGDFFAWGETKPKETYNWSTYKYYNTSYNVVTKYCSDSSHGSIDNKNELEMDDDAATVNWGVNWQMPNSAQIEELINNDYTTTTWTTINNVYGRMIISRKNGNRIFLPCSGYRRDDEVNRVGCFYWTCSLYTSYSRNAFSFYSNKDNLKLTNDFRFYGLSVRPVRAQR